jgi:hypothetical protein
MDDRYVDQDDDEQYILLILVSSPLHIRLCPGQDPATDKQKGFIHVLARQHDVKDPVPEQMSKSEASEMIEKLKRA